MYLSIDRKENDEQFSNWLLRVIKQELMSNLDPRKLRYYEDYIKESNIFNMDEKTLRNLNLNNVVYVFINTLRKHVYKHTYVYSFNTDMRYGEVTYYEIIKLISYGNTEVRAYPFIVEVFYDIYNNIEKYEYIYNTMYRRRRVQ